MPHCKQLAAYVFVRVADRQEEQVRRCELEAANKEREELRNVLILGLCCRIVGLHNQMPWERDPPLLALRVHKFQDPRQDVAKGGRTMRHGVLGDEQAREEAMG